MMRNLAEVLRLVLVTDDALVRRRDLIDHCRAAERGGVTAVQLRLKLASARELASAARELLGVLTVPLFINDRLDVAIAVGAAGAHLGTDDVPLALARRIVPRDFVLGVSVGSTDEARTGRAADYWGIGPLHGSPTKPDAGLPLCLAGFAALARLAPTHVPAIAIGGVRPDDVSAIRQMGGAGVAVAQGILGGGSVEAAARAYGTA